MFRGPPHPDADWREGRRGPMGAGPRGPMPARIQPQEPQIDREKTCPLLVRVFPKLNGHHQLEDFAKPNGLPSEVQIYTWMDATLRELSDLVKDVQAAARARNARISFAFVYPDVKGRNVMRQVGTVHATRPSDDDNKSLRQLHFQIGDYLDVAIMV